MGKYRKRSMIAIYYRISKKSKNSIRMQRKSCKEYCSKNRIKNIKEYIDKGFSGTVKNRPALKMLMKDVDEKKIKKIVIYAVDRLGRNFSQLNGLIETFENQGIELKSATQNFDISTPEGKFMLRMLTILAEFESGMISKRTIDGLRAAGR